MEKVGEEKKSNKLLEVLTTKKAFRKWLLFSLCTRRWIKTVNRRTTRSIKRLGWRSWRQNG